jgi:hypothetical protein
VLGSGGVGFAPCDPGDRGQHLLPDRGFEGSHAQGQFCAFGDDVLLGAGSHGPHGQNGGVGGGDIARHDGLELHDCRSSHDDRVDGLLRCGPVRATAVQHDLQGIAARHDRSGPEQHPPGGHRSDVLAQRHVRCAEPFEKAIGNHRRRAAADLLGRLDHQDDLAGPRVQVPDELGRDAEQPRDVHVVAARVGDGDLGALGIQTGGGAGVRQAGGLFDGEGIHVCAQQHCGTGTVVQGGHDPGSSDRRGHLEAQGTQALGHDACCSHLREGQFRIAGHVLVERSQVGQQGWDVIEHWWSLRIGVHATR